MIAATPLTGEPLPVDLVNTHTRNGDLLDTPDRLKTWLELETSRYPELTATGITTAELAAARAIREHIAAILFARLQGAAPPVSALRGINEAQLAAPATRHLSYTDETITASPQRHGTRAAVLAAVLAEAAVDLLTDPNLARLKQCEADDCVMLFIPAHPRRRWCSSKTCGNRARVARYYQRHKTTQNDEAALPTIEA
jgi:predicted RNA-binding Zn ribbon-like protein